MELVCFQGVDTESKSQIKSLVSGGEWDKVLVVKHKDAESLNLGESVEIVEIDSGKTLTELKEDVVGKIKSKLGNSLEVGLSIASGTGKEHMALISALLSVPVGIRLVAFTKNGVEFVN